MVLLAMSSILVNQQYILKSVIRGHVQDGRGVRRGDHLPPHKYIKIHLHVEQLLQNTY